MAYTSSGRLPIERASKMGHIKIIQDPKIRELVDAFERNTDDVVLDVMPLAGHVDLSGATDIENVVAIDGSHAALPNTIQQHKKLAFITATALSISRSSVSYMKANPIIDPRDLAASFDGRTDHISWALPLSGVSIPGQTVIETIRESIDHALTYWDLYDTLQFLVSREWLPHYDMDAHMDCVACGNDFYLPRSKKRFACLHCHHRHTLADYLSIATGPPHDWAKEEAAVNLRTIFETLLLMRYMKKYRDRKTLLRRTVFVKDGPLLLRAQLSRLVEPIRAFLEYLNQQGRQVHIVGVEKSGELVDHLPMVHKVLRLPGDYILPSIRYLHERVGGVPYVAEHYRNRVQYGSKVAIRLGVQHVVVCDVPTGPFLTDPCETDLYGFQSVMTVLSEMLSYRYENALIPLVLVNQMASISVSPSTDILSKFAAHLLNAGLE